MSGYWCFGLGLFLGCCAGLLIAAFLGARHQGWDEDDDRWERIQREWDKK